MAVIEPIDGEPIYSRNAEGVYNETVQTTLDDLGNENNFNRNCAEVNGISKAENAEVNLEGATISVANVRGSNSESGIHGTNKPPCDVCQPLIDSYGMKVKN